MRSGGLLGVALLTMAVAPSCAFAPLVELNVRTARPGYAVKLQPRFAAARTKRKQDKLKIIRLRHSPPRAGIGDHHGIFVKIMARVAAFAALVSLGRFKR